MNLQQCNDGFLETEERRLTKARDEAQRQAKGKRVVSLNKKLSEIREEIERRKRSP